MVTNTNPDYSNGVPSLVARRRTTHTEDHDQDKPSSRSSFSAVMKDIEQLMTPKKGKACPDNGQGGWDIEP